VNVARVACCLGQDGHDTSGYTLIRADVMRSTDVTDVSQQSPPLLLLLLLHARCPLPVNRFLDDAPWF